MPNTSKRITAELDAARDAEILLVLHRNVRHGNIRTLSIEAETVDGTEEATIIFKFSGKPSTYGGAPWRKK